MGSWTHTGEAVNISLREPGVRKIDRELGAANNIHLSEKPSSSALKFLVFHKRK
jgi:hypothetical protein